MEHHFWWLSKFTPQFVGNYILNAALRWQPRVKSFSTFAFTAASILMSGGQGPLKASPANFFVASMPNLLPPTISLVA